MDVRKVHNMGNGGVAVTLPIRDCRKLGITPGCCMTVECIDGKIVYTPVTTTRQDQKVTGAADTAMEGCRNG